MFDRLEDRRFLTSIVFEPHSLPVEDGVAYSGMLDVDGDGDLDLLGIRADQKGRAYAVTVVNGRGTFSLNEQELESGFETRLWWGDLDSDGDLDFVTGRGTFYSNQAGSFEVVHEPIGTVPDAPHLPGHLEDVEIVDADGDGDNDVLFVGSFGSFGSGVGWVENLGAGVGFSDIVDDLGAVDGTGKGVGLDDLDGDGKGDVWVVAPSPECDQSTSVGRYLPGLGNGVFGLAESLLVDEDQSFCRAVSAFTGDPDRDGDVDLIVDFSGDRESEVRLNDGSGSLQTGWRLGGLTTLGGSLVDIDLDGTPDLAGYLAGRGGSQEERECIGCLAWKRGDGQSFGETRVFSDPVDDFAPTLFRDAWGDLDGDGDWDAAIGGFWYESNAAEIRSDLTADGVVGFSDFLVLSSNFGRQDEAVSHLDGDINGDGSVDFADFLIFSSAYGLGLGLGARSQII